MQDKETKFKFWVPAEIEKGKKDAKGKEKWKFKGIASTADVDTDGEVLQPEGFDLSYFLSDGFVNWNHQSKNNPSAIIGEPTMAEVVPEGLYVETELYQDSLVASSVWDLGKILDKASSNRKLGFSIEGKVVERDPNDDKKVTKAKITGLAITPSPKNKSTFADIVKGTVTGELFEGEWEYELLKGENIEGEFIVDITDENGDRVTVDKTLNINIVKAKTTDKIKPERKDFDSDDAFNKAVEDYEKSLGTSGGAAITPSTFSNANPHFKPDKKNLKNNSEVNLDNSKDSFNLKKNLTKSEVYEKLFIEITTDLEKADQIYSLIEKIELKSSNNMTLVKSISMDSINKAYEALGVNFEKGEQNSAGMTNSKADTTPALADSKMPPGDANGGMTEDMVIGMYKGMDGDTKSKKDMVSKAIEKGVSEDMANKAYSKAVEKGIIKADTTIEDEDDEEFKKKKEAVKKAEDRVLKAEKEVVDAKKEFETLKKEGKKKVKKSDEEDEDEGDDTEEENKKVTKGKIKKSETSDDLVKALLETGNIVKELAEQNKELSKVIVEQGEEFKKSLADQSKKIEEFEKSTPGRRSVQTTQFLEKGQLNEVIKKAEGEGKTVLKLSDPSDSKTLLNMLEKAALPSREQIEKGHQPNKFLADSMCQLELGPEMAVTWLKQPGHIAKIEEALKVKLID